MCVQLSLKMIELQVALPRTQDAGKLQEQMQQRGQHLSEHAASSVQKQTEINRKSVNKQEQKDKVHWKNPTNQQGKQEQQANQQDEDKQEFISQVQKHPFKGKHIDFSG